jgi:hypothetical protein
MSRVDQERVTVTVEGLGQTLNLGVFDGFSGGAKKGETTKHRSGGMGPQKSLGGPSTRDDFSTMRLYDLERDHPFMKRLDALVNIGEVTAVRQKLNKDKTPAGEPITYTGTLSGYVMPDHDSDSSEKAMFTLEVSADEPIS